MLLSNENCSLYHMYVQRAARQILLQEWQKRMPNVNTKAVSYLQKVRPSLIMYSFCIAARLATICLDTVVLAIHATLLDVWKSNRSNRITINEIANMYICESRTGTTVKEKRLLRPKS